LSCCLILPIEADEVEAAPTDETPKPGKKTKKNKNKKKKNKKGGK